MRKQLAFVIWFFQGSSYSVSLMRK